MKVYAVGVGNAFSMRNYHQSFLLEENEERFLVDCGTRIPYALWKQKIDPRTIGSYYFSHLHSDHCGGLEEIGFLLYDWTKKPANRVDSPKAPKLYANSALLRDGEEHTFGGGLDSVEGIDASLKTFFDIEAIGPNKKFIWQGWTFELVQQIHIMTGSVIKPTFGLYITKEGHKSIYLTTDSQHCSPRQIEYFYKHADIIIQDCECIGVNLLFQEGTSYYRDTDNKIKLFPKDAMEIMDVCASGGEEKKWECFKFASGVHANYGQLAGYPSSNSPKLPADIKAKMWLSHYQDFVLDGVDFFGNPVNWKLQAEKDGFAGFAQVGQTWEI